MRLAALLLLACSFALCAETSNAPTGADTESTIADLFARSRFDDAHAAALSWQERAPKDALAAYWVGRTSGQLAMGAGMFRAMSLAGDSREAFELSVELDPSNVDAQFALMQYYLIAPGIAGGDKDEAKAIAQRIEQLSPSAGHKAQAQFLYRAKDMDGYLREIEAALALAPADPELVGSLVGQYLAKNDAARAKGVLDAALALEPEHPLLRYQYAKWVALTGQELEPGLQAIDALLAQTRYPKGFSATGAHFRRAQILKQLDRKPDAIAALEAALQFDPESEELQKELDALKAG